MSLETAEIGFWIALTVWVLAFLLQLLAIIRRSDSLLRFGVYLVIAGLVPHFAGTGARWLISGRPPFINLYELVIASAFVAVATYLVAQLIWKAVRPVGVAVLPVAFLSMGAAMTLSPEANVLTPSLKSWWLVIHITFAMIAHGCFAVAFGASVLLLRKTQKPSAEQPGFIPPPKTLDRIAMQSIIYGFICHTCMLLSGSIWANKAWGRFWGWDPIEVWALITWLMYGLYVHLRFIPSWQGRRAAVYAVVAFLVVVFSFWGVPHLWTTIHDYTLYGKPQ